MAPARYTAVGTFHTLHPGLPDQGPVPDGDTINFLPDNDDPIRALEHVSGTHPNHEVQPRSNRSSL